MGGEVPLFSEKNRRSVREGEDDWSRQSSRGTESERESLRESQSEVEMRERWVAWCRCSLRRIDGR